MGEITLDSLPSDHEINCCWVDMLVDFISCNSSWVTPKHVKVWSLSKKVVFIFFFTLLAACFFLTNLYNVFLDGYQCGIVLLGRSGVVCL